MNKSALRNFATEARKELRDKIIIKALQLGITEENIKKESVQSSDAVFIENRQLTREEQSQRNRLIEEINIKGYNQVIEEVAYTWFNRFTALRFMEVNNYLPTRVKVLSSEIEGSYEPDIIKEALNIDLDIDKELVYKLKTSNENDAIDRLYKYLIIKQCNALNDILPLMFEKIMDYTELLFPDGLLADGSFLRVMTDPNNIPVENWEDVEVIGWLYQYYISERKDEVFARPKSKKIERDDIAPATQLFTPHWIVRYMVENSVGKLWQEGHPNEELKENWKYYIEEAEQEGEVKKELDKLREENKKLKVEDIKIIDPAMGSGHILVYAFDLLYDIYLSEGYIAQEIPKLIIEKNLYGIDIDERAFQLAYFALMMKGRSRSRRFFNEGVEVNIISIEESNGFPKEAIEYFLSSKSLDLEKQIVENDLEYLIDVFHDAKEYGSILKVEKIKFDLIGKRLEEIRRQAPEDMFELQHRNKILEVIPGLVKQGRLLSNKYDAVIANPPYSGFRKLNDKMKKYIEQEYEDYKHDLFSVFIKQNYNLCSDNGYLGFMTPNVWQYISSYEKLRMFILSNMGICNLIQLEDDGFKEASVSISTFTLRKDVMNLFGIFIDMGRFEFNGEQEDKVAKMIAKDVEGKYKANRRRFEGLPSKRIAFWSSERTIHTFNSGTPLGDVAMPRQGMATSNNEEFLRFWYEVLNEKINYDSNGESIMDYWIPYNKGGGFRKWYGNNNSVIFWENNGEAVKRYAEKLYGSYSRTIKNENFFFKKGLTYSFIGKSIGPRYSESGFIFDVAGSSIFIKDMNELKYIMGILASNLSNYYMDMLNPSLNIQVGDLKSIPIIFTKERTIKELIISLTDYNIQIARTDWDSFETSWDFKIHPFLKHLDIGEPYKLSAIFNMWETETDEAFNQLKSNEEELNCIFIDIYGLQDELTPEVEDKDITIYKADREKDVKSFISYTVGCMFGRYSLDEDGLAYAGGEFDSSKYKIFPADKDNIIPILSDSYFEDDIVSRFEEFVKITFGEDTLNENLKYIAESLGVRADETPKETIRRYFLNDFYKTHTQIYKKRPIYWLFTSGKEKAFNALIYMHRYDRSTLARIRTDYLHVLQSRLDVERENLKDIVAEEDNAREKKKYEKDLKDLEKKIAELKKYDEVLHTMADQMIEIDLDDGVKINYDKFEGLMAKI